MKFKIRFAIGNRLGAASRYTLREFCVSVVDLYCLTSGEIEAIITLEPWQVFRNNEIQVERIK